MAGVSKAPTRQGQALVPSSEPRRNHARTQSASSNALNDRSTSKDKQLQTTKLDAIAIPEEKAYRGDASSKLSKTWGPSTAGRWVVDGRRNSETSKRIVTASASAPGFLHAIGMNQMPPSTAGSSKTKRQAMPRAQIMLFPSLLDAEGQMGRDSRPQKILEAREVSQSELPRIQTPNDSASMAVDDHSDIVAQHRIGTPVLPLLGEDAKLDGIKAAQFGDVNDIEAHMGEHRGSKVSNPDSASTVRRTFSPSRSLRAGEALNGATIEEWIVRRAAISTGDTNRSLGSAQLSSSPRRSALSLKMGGCNEELEKQDEEMRTSIRVELIRVAGSPQEAFRAMDLSGSGHISFSEFSDGLRRLGIDWREMTGLWKVRELFKLFDKEAPHGVLSFTEIFPKRGLLGNESERVSTPEFWNRWCQGTKGAGLARPPQWSNSTKEEDLQKLFDTAKVRQDVADKRRWISSTMRRLKTQGKSSARCREVCVRHLPRGTGPKDCDEVHTFSEAEVKACKRSYHDKVNTPVRNIQKTIYDMREQRKVLQISKMKMLSVAHRYAEHKAALGGILNMQRYSTSSIEEGHFEEDLDGTDRRTSDISLTGSIA